MYMEDRKLKCLSLIIFRVRCWEERGLLGGIGKRVSRNVCGIGLVIEVN